MKPLPPPKRKKLSLASIFFTFFVDNLSWSIVFPVFAPFFLDPNNELFSPSVSTATRTTILGFFLGIFPFAQFFGAPLIGEFADRNGRKKALLYTIFFTFIGFALCAYSMQEKILWLLFISRLITGLFSGNLSICLASVVDLSKDEKIRVKNFGYLAVFAGFSFIIGAFIGGKFSDSEVSIYFNPALPFWIATLITLLNLIFVFLGFKETHVLDEHVQFNFWQGFHNIYEALKTKNIKIIYLIYFLFLFSWNILFQFTPVLVVDSFDFSNSEIGDIAAFMGICWAVGSGYLSKVLLRYFNGYKILEMCLLLFTLLSALIILPKNVVGLLFIIGICVILAGLAWPICTNVISSRAGSRIQGKVLGMSQSMQSLAMAFSPLVAVFTHFYLGLPFIIAAISSLAAGIIYFRLHLD